MHHFCFSLASSLTACFISRVLDMLLYMMFRRLGFSFSLPVTSSLIFLTNCFSPRQFFPCPWAPSWVKFEVSHSTSSFPTALASPLLMVWVSQKLTHLVFIFVSFWLQKHSYLCFCGFFKRFFFEKKFPLNCTGFLGCYLFLSMFVPDWTL